jgi:hypothetical protein
MSEVVSVAVAIIGLRSLRALRSRRSGCACRFAGVGAMSLLISRLVLEMS